MAKETGRNVLLKIGAGDDDPGPETFTSLPGQVETRMRNSGTSEDSSTKESGAWLERIPIDIDTSVSCNGRAMWPDANGLDRLRTVWESKGTINCQVVLDSTGQQYEGPFVIEQLEIGGAKSGITEYAVELAAAGDLTHTPGT